MPNQEIQKKILKLISSDNKLCLVPSDIYKDGKKVPWGKWRKTSIIDPIQLFDILDNIGTEKVALVCGIKSGNLICVDIDEKHCGGISQLVFRDLRELLPTLWERLRIEKTINGGYHLFYRINLVGEEKCPNENIKLARRLLDDGKSWQDFIELKCEGGICQTYPSEGYELVYDRPIPIFSLSEHKEIIYLVRSFDKQPEQELTFNSGVTNFKNELYTNGKNPFECFDDSDEGARLLENEGWRQRRNKIASDCIGWIKPNGKGEDIQAFFHTKKRFYSVYIDEGVVLQGFYKPSKLLCLLKYGNTKSESRKSLYAHLVKEGYGEYSEVYENNVIKRFVKQRKEVTDLPKNFSEEAKIEFVEAKKKNNELYPYGVFWYIEENGSFYISQKNIDEVVVAMEYKWYGGKIYKVDEELGYLLKTVTEQELFHSLLLYIGDNDEMSDVYDEYSKHIVKYGKLTIERLKEFSKLDESRLLLSSKFISYKFYKNCYLKITKDEIEEVSYSLDIGDKFVFEDNIIKRNYNQELGFKKSMYWEYLSKSVGVGNGNYVFNVIGYLIHDFIDDSMNSIIVASESFGDGRKIGGGSGKNIFFNLLNHISSVHVIDGRQVETDKNLLQSYNFEKILVLSDVEEKFDYSFFKNFSSNTSAMKKLYQDVIILKRKQMPKLAVLTNYSYKVTSGLERRIIPLEFSDFFAKIRGGVGKHFKCMFPGKEREDELGDWDEIEWNCFDSIMSMCIQSYLSVGELVPNDLSESGWEKQFKQNYTEQTLQFINDNINTWLCAQEGKVDTKDFNDKYETFCKENHIQLKYQASSTLINRALEDYCEYNKIEFLKNQTWKVNNIGVKGRIFIGESVKVDLPF
jgi:hypothetical protein